MGGGIPILGSKFIPEIRPVWELFVHMRKRNYFHFLGFSRICLSDGFVETLPHFH